MFNILRQVLELQNACLQMNPRGPCFTIFTQNVPGVCDSSELQSTGTLRSGSKGQYTPQLSSYLIEQRNFFSTCLGVWTLSSLISIE